MIYDVTMILASLAPLLNLQQRGKPNDILPKLWSWMNVKYNNAKIVLYSWHGVRITERLTGWEYFTDFSSELL